MNILFTCTQGTLRRYFADTGRMYAVSCASNRPLRPTDYDGDWKTDSGLVYATIDHGGAFGQWGQCVEPIQLAYRNYLAALIVGNETAGPELNTADSWMNIAYGSVK